MQWLIDKLLGIDRVALGEGEWSIAWRNAPEIWVLILLIIPAVILGIYFIYRREGQGATPTMKVFLTFLRCLLIFILLAILFEPVLTVERRLERQSILIVLVDESLSMSFKDKFPDPDQHLKLGQLTGVYQPGETPSLEKDKKLDSLSRIDLVNHIFTNPTLNLLKNLAPADKYEIKAYAFSGEIRGDVRFGEIKPEGDRTAIGNSLQAVINELSGRLIAGVILISDGQNNVGVDPIDSTKELAQRGSLVPVYTVAAGNPQEPKDIQVLELKVPPVAIAKDFVNFDFSVKSSGYDNETVTVRLLQGEQVVADKNITLLGQNRSQPVSLRYKPEEPGEFLCRVEVPLQTGELIEENNFVSHNLKVVDERINVLYIESYPRWEYKYLFRALERDIKSMKFWGWLISAEKGFPQECSSDIQQPLRYLPLEKEELLKYDVIIFGDVDPRHLSDPAVAGRTFADPSKVMENIVTFVEEMGGGIAFISGPRYNPRTFRNTPFTDLLPVLLEDEDFSIVDWGESLTEAFKLKLTPEGKEDAIMTLLPEPEVNIELWEDNDQQNDGLPGLLWYYPVRKIKPIGHALAVHPFSKNKYGPRPIFATMPYQRGQVFFTATDETWRWRFGVGDKYQYKFWGNIIRYLRSGRTKGSKRYNIYVDKPKYSLGEKVVITARIYDEKFEPITLPAFTTHLELPNGLKKDIELTQKAKKPGQYEGAFKPTETGSYRVWAGPEGIAEDKEKSFAPFVVQLPMYEQQNPMVDKKTLEMIAKNTNGKFIPIYEIDKLPDLIMPTGETMYTETKEDDLWDSPLFFLVFLLIITAEWVIRKFVRLL